MVRQLQLVDSSVFPPIYNETLFEYNDPNNPNLLTKQIDPNLSVTQKTYTANGNLKTEEVIYRLVSLESRSRCDRSER